MIVLTAQNWEINTNASSFFAIPGKTTAILRKIAKFKSAKNLPIVNKAKYVIRTQKVSANPKACASIRCKNVD